MNTPEIIELAVKEYLNQMTPEQLAKSNAYFEGGYWLQLWNFLATMLMVTLLMMLGWSQKINAIARRATRYEFARSAIYFALFLMATTLLFLPLTIYQDYFREHQYGLSNLTFGDWALEYLKAFAVSLILVPVFGAMIYSLIRRLPRGWWVGGALATIAFISFTATVGPVFIAPIFNSYKPLRAGEVRESVLALAKANGVPADEVYEFDASKQSKRISANVSGMFGTTRISLNDNLLNRTSLAETRHVMAHEIGHYVLDHVSIFLTRMTLVMVLGFYLVSLGMSYFIRRWGLSQNVNSVGDLTGFPVLYGLFAVFFFLFTPINNTIVRVSEVQADLFALNSAREPDAAAKVAIALSEYRKISPSKWEEVIFYDHPSGESRIRAAMTWKAQNLPSGSRPSQN